MDNLVFAPFLTAGKEYFEEVFGVVRKVLGQIE
jgi:hypothetical protein